MSSIITISQPPSVPGDKSITETPIEMTFAPFEGDHDEPFYSDTPAVTSESEDEACKKANSIDESLRKLEAGTRRDSRQSSPQTDDRKRSDHKTPGLQATTKRRKKANKPDAVIVLKEEKVRTCSPLHHFSLARVLIEGAKIKASTFHDFLKFVYPQ